MAIDEGPYCAHCTDDSGKLQSFDDRFERMVQWTQRQDDAITRPEAEAKARAYMATMPAWRDHPRLSADAPPSES